MESAGSPVVVYHGKNDFDAQMARDVLQSAMIPTVHIPSLSTGIFGVAQATRVAVPEEFADAALETLLEEGFEARLEMIPKGLAAFRETVRDKLPVESSSSLPAGSQLRSMLLGIAVIILSLVVWTLIRTR